jgi:hypothetical protein
MISDNSGPSKGENPGGNEPDTPVQADGTPGASLPPTAPTTSIPPTPEEIKQFLTTIFDDKDKVLTRPIETWTEGTIKRSRVIYKEVRYREAKQCLYAGVWARTLKIGEENRANLFFGVCPRFCGSGGTFDLAWQIRTVRVLWSDIDHCTPEEALKRCEAAGLPRPTIVVRSGQGVHLYWRLVEPYLIADAGDPAPVKTEWIKADGKNIPRHYIEVDAERIDEYLDPTTKKKNPLWSKKVSPQGQFIQDILAGIAAKINGDHTQDLSRLLRLPCTLNRKDQRNGKEPVPCELVECNPTRRYSLADFEKVAEASPAKTKAKEVAKLRLPAGVKLTPGRLNSLNAYINSCAVAPVGQRSGADYALCMWAIEKGIDKEEIWPQVDGVGKFGERGRAYFDITWEATEGDARQKVYDRTCRKVGIHTATTMNGAAGSRNGIVAPRIENEASPGQVDPEIDTAAGEESVATSGPDCDETPSENQSDDELPTIQGNKRQLRYITDQAMRAMCLRNNPPTVFHRGGVLVRLRVNESTGAPYLDVLADNSLRGVLGRVADWTKVRDTKQGGAEEDAPPPKEVVEDITGLPTWEGIPLIESVAESPFFERTGRLVATPGFHPEARVWFHQASGLEIPPVSPSPSQEEIGRAKELLLIELLGDFPFVDVSSKANAVASVLLPSVRRLIDGPTPMHLVDAPTEGTGKTLLINVITMIATGHKPETMAEANCDEEWRKRITAKLLKAPTFIVLDNLRRTLDTGALASVLTAETWEDRILGYSKTAVIPNTAVWMASGNNTRLSLELIRRTLWIRIDAKTDVPSERTGFRHPNLTRWVEANRGQLVWATLTLCQAWIAAGKPSGNQTLGMFESWVEVIGGILDVVGVPGLLANAKGFRAAASDKTSEWQSFLAAWREVHGINTVGVEELYALASQRSLLDAELGDGGTRSQRTKLGLALGRMRDRVIGGFRYERVQDDHSGRKRYQLQTIEPVGQTEPPQPSQALQPGEDVGEWSA